MSRITDYVLEPNIVYTNGSFLIKVKVQDSYKYKKYLVSENIKYKTISGTTFTLTDVKQGQPGSILQLEGNTTQNGTPTPTSPIEINTVSKDSQIRVCGKNLIKTLDGNYNYSTTSLWTINNGEITTTITDINYQGGALNVFTGNTGRWASSVNFDNNITTKGGSYVITGLKEGSLTYGSGGNLYIYLFIYKDDGTTRNDYITLRNDTQSKVITLANNEHIGSVALYSQFITCNNIKVKIQLEKRKCGNSL